MTTTLTSREEFLKKNTGATFKKGDFLVPSVIHNPQNLLKGVYGFGCKPPWSKDTLRTVMCGYNAKLVLVQDYNRPGSCQNAGGQARYYQILRQAVLHSYPTLPPRRGARATCAITR